MHSLSIVIPVQNERENLAQLAEHLGSEASFAEIIVVDAVSRDGSSDLARLFANKVIHSEPGRAKQMNTGAEAASNDYLMFLHADTRLPAGFANEFSSWSQANPEWGFFPVKLDGGHWMFRVIEWMISHRSKLTHGASGDQAICVRRARFHELGGYEDIPLMEDLALSRALSQRQRPMCFKKPVMTSSRRWQQNGILKTVLLMWRLRFLYYMGVAPRKLAALYR